MNTTMLSRRLGLDGNPLRRRIDKLAACMAALLMAVFLIGAPMLSVAVDQGLRVARSALTTRRAAAGALRGLAF
jgi:hypothetical protein